MARNEADKNFTDTLDSALDESFDSMEASHEEPTPSDTTTPLEDNTKETPIDTPKEPSSSEVKEPTDETKENIPVETKQISEAVKAETDTKEATISPTEVPQFWPAQLKKAAVEGSKEALIKEFAAFDQQREAWAKEVLVEAQTSKELRKDIEEATKPLEADMLQYGLTPIKLLARAVDWIKLEKSYPLQAAKAYVSNLGLTPEQLLQDDGSGQNYNPEQSQFQSKVEELQTKIQQLEHSRIQEREQAALMEVERFKNERDTSGNLLRPHFDALKPNMQLAAKQLLKEYPNMPDADVIRYSYDYVVKTLGLQPQVKPVKSQEQIVAEAKKAKAAASSISGNPVTSSKPRQGAPKKRIGGREELDISTVVDEVWDEVEARH